MTDENSKQTPEIVNESPPLSAQEETEEPFEQNGAPEIDVSEESPEESPQSINELELLGEQFENYMNIAKGLMKTLKRPKDIEICGDLLRRVQKLNDSRHLEVKRNNNRFFRYCLRVLKWTSENQPLHLYRQLYNQDVGEIDKDLEETTIWLSENKFYMASKSYKDGTSLIYMAVANATEAGWQRDGFKILEKRGACERS